MNRTSTRTSGDRIAMGLARSVVDTINDSPFMQTLGIKIRGTETSTDVEHFHPFGFTHVPMGKTTDAQAQAGMMKGAAEVILGTLMGNNSHPIGFPAADRRFRLNGLAGGEVGLHDAFKQFLHMGQDAARLISPKRVGIEVSREKQPAQGSGSGASTGSGSGSGSGGGQQQRNSGADVKADRERMGGIVFNEDGSWTLEAKGPGKIKIGDVTWEFTKDGLVQTGGTLKHNAKNIGADHKHGGVMSGGSNTDVPSN